MAVAEPGVDVFYSPEEKKVEAPQTPPRDDVYEITRAVELMSSLKLERQGDNKMMFTLLRLMLAHTMNEPYSVYTDSKALLSAVYLIDDYRKYRNSTRNHQSGDDRGVFSRWLESDTPSTPRIILRRTDEAVLLRYVSQNSEARLVVVSDIELDLPGFIVRTCEGIYLYSYHYAVEWRRVVDDEESRFIFTDFISLSEVYRIHDKRSRDLMEDHLFLANDVTVSSNIPHHVSGFPRVVPPSASDVGMVTSTFETGCASYLSLRDGKVRPSAIARPTIHVKEIHVLEGTFVKLPSAVNANREVSDEFGEKYVYATKSQMLFGRLKNKENITTDVFRVKLYVYNRDIKLSPKAEKEFQMKEFDKCGRYLIGKL
jgi:hypothetical protein